MNSVLGSVQIKDGTLAGEDQNIGAGLLLGS